jgi:hypothetical protein
LVADMAAMITPGIAEALAAAVAMMASTSALSQVMARVLMIVPRD